MNKEYTKLQNGSDVRGVASDLYGKTVDLTEEAASDIAYGFGRWLSEVQKKSPAQLTVAVGRDSRFTGPALQEAVCASLSRMGYRVLDCGLASTPAMFMSCVFPQTACDGAVMITASHLPPDRNGLKFFEKHKGGLDKADIRSILQTAAGVSPSDEEKQPRGEHISFDLMDLYCAHLRSRIAAILGLTEADKPLQGLKVCVDAGNGAGGFYASGVLQPLGADVSSSQFLEPDGRFPNHAPNPEDAAAVESLSARVLQSGADLGIIFDTDVDRMAVAGSNGEAIARNGIVALAALLSRSEDAQGAQKAQYPRESQASQEPQQSQKSPKPQHSQESESRPVIVTDSVTSTQLADFLKTHGFEHLRYQRGYKNVINKARALTEEGVVCPLAIETSGHAALKENYFLDDGAYLAAKVVAKAAQLKQKAQHIEDLLTDLAQPLEASEYRLSVNAEDFSTYADSVLEALRAQIASGEVCGMSLELPNYEGIRVNVWTHPCRAKHAAADGWFLLRKSLHDPLMPLNVESNVPGGAEDIAGRLRKLLQPFELLDLSKLPARDGR